MAEEVGVFEIAFIASGLAVVLEGVMITQGYILLSMLAGFGTLKPIFTDFMPFGLD